MKAKIEIYNDARAAFNTLLGRLGDLTPVTRAISTYLLSRTEGNLAAQSGPGGAWPPLSPATKKRRGAEARMLQESGRLAGSITPSWDAGSAGIGSNVIYAAIHQLGGDIERQAYSGSVRLRTTATGNLLRQGAKGRAKNLAVFAKAKHKRTRTVDFTAGGHTIHIPARPYFPVYPDRRLQEGAADEILTMLSGYIGGQK